MNTNSESISNNLKPGIYEQLIDATVEKELADTEAAAVRAPISDGPVDVSHAISSYIERAVRHSIAGLSVEKQIETANSLLRSLAGGDRAAAQLRSDMLLALHGGTFRDAPEALRCRPTTPLSKNAVFTATEQDPQLYYELKREICSSDRIYLVVSFIRWSGLDLLYDALRGFTRRGGSLRVVTTTYVGATQIQALDRLASLPNTQIRISLDGTGTRLHAKAYVFERESGFSTAYVGSSNMSHPALTAGYEWNTKIASACSPDVYRKILVTCEEYWTDPEFVPFDDSIRDTVAEALSSAGSAGPAKPVNIPFGKCTPFPYQQEVLERLKAERVLHDRWKNLIVAATGTGKTMMAAFDYARFRRERPGEPCRLLFVAHRKEILEQSLQTFRRVLGDPDFGELQVGGYQAIKMDHVFMSIQSANVADLCGRLDRTYFDYIVVDEFHHAAAPSYRKLLDGFDPVVLLGLTATPERADGQSILDYFDGRIAAEIRLPAAIDQALLCPFHYFGLPDTVDLDQVKWRQGGYDLQELDKLYSLDEHVARKRADHIYGNLIDRTSGLEDVKALGFCVSVSHAAFMERCFRGHGVPCRAVSGETPPAERRAAIADLSAGRIKVIFCVDLLNEGVDIPEVNTVMFLRPTESLTVFLQQLGRGLRLSPDKDHLLVLDFIGLANRRYRFDEKYGALVRNPRAIKLQIKDRFPSMPRGCYIELSEKPMQVVLETVSRGYSTKAVLLRQAKEYHEERGAVPTLAQFLEYAHVEPSDLYRTCLYSRLLMDAGLLPPQEIPMEKDIQKGLLRISCTNSPRWMKYLVSAIPSWADADFSGLTEDEQLMTAMLYLSIWDENIQGVNAPGVRRRLAAIAASEILVREITDLLLYIVDSNMCLTVPLHAAYPCPLEIHGTYTRNQVYAALGNLRPKGQQGGVLYVPARNAEVLFVTLNKDERHFGESIQYKDYAVGADHFHWQSKNSTAPESPAGQRYIRQSVLGTSILLFVRQAKQDSHHAAVPYHFVGPVRFVRSTGSRPMNILWRLEYPMDAAFLQEASRLVV